jgi:hypothetical protein
MFRVDLHPDITGVRLPEDKVALMDSHSGRGLALLTFPAHFEPLCLKEIIFPTC